MLRLIALLAGGWEFGWWLRRRSLRGSTFATAQAEARRLNKPLIVIGAPDRGATRGDYGCGDVTVDVQSSSCAMSIQADVTKRLPFADDSAVVFVSCVLEYVSDLGAALREIRRVGGRNVYIVRVEPWTMAAYLYPGAKRTIPRRLVERL